MIELFFARAGRGALTWVVPSSSSVRDSVEVRRRRLFATAARNSSIVPTKSGATPAFSSILSIAR